jgi:AcrR family transcriptional regulator
VFDTAIAIYAAGGWSDLTFDAVARAAGVGKAAIYRRWPTRGDLLREMLEARWYRVGAIEGQTLADDLTALARMCFDSLAGPYGDVALHLRADARHDAEVRRHTLAYGRDLVFQARQIIRRAIARGELPPEARPGLIIDIIVGAVTNRFSATPQRLREAVVAQRDRFISDLVSIVMRGLGKR